MFLHRRLAKIIGENPWYCLSVREKVNQFWKLLSSSGLMSATAVQDLIAKSQNDATLADDLERLTRWLVDKGAVTEYQASVLANGQATNFRFGEYQLLDRVRVGDGTTDFLARHASNYYVLLKFLKGVDQDDALRWRAVRIRGDLIAECDSPYLSACFQTVKLAQPNGGLRSSCWQETSKDVASKKSAAE